MRCLWSGTALYGTEEYPETSAVRISNFRMFQQLRCYDWTGAGCAPVLPRKEEGLLGEWNPTFTHSFNDNDSQAATGKGRNILCKYGGQPWLCYSTNVCNLRAHMTCLHERCVDAADDQVKNKIWYLRSSWEWPWAHHEDSDLHKK